MYIYLVKSIHAVEYNIYLSKFLYPKHHKSNLQVNPFQTSLTQNGPKATQSLYIRTQTKTSQLIKKKKCVLVSHKRESYPICIKTEGTYKKYVKLPNQDFVFLSRHTHTHTLTHETKHHLTLYKIRARYSGHNLARTAQRVYIFIRLKIDKRTPSTISMFAVKIIIQHAKPPSAPRTVYIFAACCYIQIYKCGRARALGRPRSARCSRSIRADRDDQTSSAYAARAILLH